MKSALNILIQLLWVALCLFLAYLLANIFFDNIVWKYIFSGLFAVIIYFLFFWIQESIKSSKDPDVQAASNLKIGINHYRLYKRLWDEYQEVLKIHGIHSSKTEEKFKELFKQIPNPDEWRRFSQYMEEKQRKEMMTEIYKDYK